MRENEEEKENEELYLKRIVSRFEVSEFIRVLLLQTLGQNLR